MRLVEFGLLYLLLGAGSAVVAMVRTGLRRVGVDSILMLLFWPLYLPVVLFEKGETSPASAEPTNPPDVALASLLPDAQAVGSLKSRVTDAERRIEEIDRLLAQPDFCEDATASRLLELEPEGRAAQSVKARLTNIRRLARLRERFKLELTEINELLAQLRVQSEVVRLSGRSDEASEALVHELMGRVEGLDVMLSEEALA